MASNKKTTGQIAQAEIGLLHSLKNCLVNLPAPLVAVLLNANTIAQNVVIELNYRQQRPPSGSGSREAPISKSVFVGWTGLQSKRKVAGVVGKDGLNIRGGTAGRDQDVSIVEMDATFARLLGIEEGQRVGVLLHLDPPQAHTINIEPLIPADWEMIELHAQFLELNFLSQVRALPNPSYSPSPDTQKHVPHPLTLHLSPTSTANITVTSLIPAPASSSPFIKISPDAEVIVAPKTRQSSERLSNRENRSVASTSRRSAGGKSGASTVRRRSTRDESSNRGPLYLRGIDRGLGGDLFEDAEGMDDEGLKVWVDPDLLSSKELKGATWVSVSIVTPVGIQEPVDPQKEPDVEKPASKVVARVGLWEYAPDAKHIALSSVLCDILGSEGMVGGLVRVEVAPPQTYKSLFKSQTNSGITSKDVPIKILQVLPFSTASPQGSGAIKFGGESKQEREEGARLVQKIFGKTPDGNGLLDGPLTHGMVLPPAGQPGMEWPGGVIKFDPAPPLLGESKKSPLLWILGSERTLPIELQSEITKPTSHFKSSSVGETIPKSSPVMAGIDTLIEQLLSHLSHSSSVLLTGGLGSGKTSLTHLLAHRLQNEHLFHTIYFPCRSLVTDETRVSTVKDTLNRLFSAASWGARQGGRSLIVLDDVDRLCPVETELQVGGENGRSRHISECMSAVIRQYCYLESGVVLLVTAQAKEAVNNVLIGGHIVREIVSLKAPNKEGRRRVLEMLVDSDKTLLDGDGKMNNTSLGKQNGEGTAWMDGTSSSSRPSTSGHGHGHRRTISQDGFIIDKSIDFLDLAGQTDGYMPGDLVLLVSRARNEALIRSVSSQHPQSGTIYLRKDDFAAAIKGFTPASLRNVTLQSSTTRWDSIGGLHSTRQILLETLQYPTTYAPIFAQCSLRLRSGLLLYGYPGCGKTLLASAVAGECGLNFISVKGPEILNKYIGASEKSVRDLFERAEAARPCVLFFDEFDSIAPKRGHDSTGVTDRVVNQLLTQMDGAEGLSGVYVLAATSRPDLIDPALLRPGRLDKSLICDMPDLGERVDILKAVTRNLNLDDSVLDTDESSGDNLWEIARRTEGYSGADLQAVMYNAQLEAIHDVLDAEELSANSTQSKNKKSKINGHGPGPSSKGLPEFSYFRFGDNAADTNSGNAKATPSAALTERAAIAAKISAINAARRRQKALQNQLVSNSSVEIDKGRDSTAGKEPTIEWKHIVSSLRTTRSSISPEERRRLAAIYREFVVGRNGEMPNGQGGNEIGGRSSLM
ncbi:AAA-domain-containing protein [Patellaria atrata CBS 101060]|uniref:Peroxisomal ATPase PEX1 n=1 Tax=Patellaria atrata CBS 101060 TaxID=1346257 RepID=A0A9P4VWL6_9PEZI|nr:AAA-domain-containing protein [Patellaria atrata CBS 101060]